MLSGVRAEKIGRFFVSVILPGIVHYLCVSARRDRELSSRAVVLLQLSFYQTAQK